MFVLHEVIDVKEIRAPLPNQTHRLLKEEAARKDLHLKNLVAMIIEEHVHRETKNPNQNSNQSTNQK